MHPEPTFRIMGYGMWAGGLIRPEELGQEITEGEVNAALPEGRSIEKRARRRATLLSRATADAFFQATEMAGVDRSAVPTVFCSALGETPAMIEQVDQVCRGVELSPMRFAVSVHSSSSTVVTISEKNRKLTSSISANFDTVAAGLFEMGAYLRVFGGKGVVIFADDHSPDQFLGPEERYARVSVALVLSLEGSRASKEGSKEEGQGGLSLPTLEVEGFTESLSLAPLPGPLARNPVAGALDLLFALGQGHSGALRLDRGEGSGYQVIVNASGASRRAPW